MRPINSQGSSRPSGWTWWAILVIDDQLILDRECRLADKLAPLSSGRPGIPVPPASPQERDLAVNELLSAPHSNPYSYA